MLSARKLTPAEKRQYDSQIDAERRGAPIPGDIAARMTKPKVADTAYQVYVDIKGEDGSRPIGPKFVGGDGEEACSQLLQAVNAQICLGNLKGWGNARVERDVHVTS